MQRAWITGIAGFLGGNTARGFLGDGWTVAGIGNPGAPDAPPSAVSVVEGRPLLIQGAVTTAALEDLLAMTGPPDVVVHAAGTGTVGPSFADPLNDFHRVVGTAATLLDVLRRHAPRARLILPSSAAIYGIQPNAPIAEDTAPSPMSPYGGHKLVTETLCRQAWINFGQPISVVRFFSLYGPGLRKQLLWDLAGRLKSRPDTLTMDGTGGEVRDFLFIDDAVGLIQRTARDADDFLVVNGGTGVSTTVREVAEAMIARISPSTSLVFSGNVRAGDPRYLLAGSGRARALGWAPRVTLREGLDRYVAWLHEIGHLT